MTSMNTVNTSVYTNDNSQGRFVLTNYIDMYKLRARNNVPTTDTFTSSATMAQSGTGMTNVPNAYTNVSSTTETKDKTTTTTTTTTTSSANTNSGIRSNSIQNDSYTKTVGSVPPVNTNNQTVTTQKSTVTTSTTGNAAPSGINNNTGTTKVETTTTTQQVKPNSPVKTTTEYKSTYKTEEKKSSGIFPWILSAGLAVLSGILLYKNRKLSGNIDEAVEKKYGELKKGYEETIAKLNEKIEGLEKNSSPSTSTTTPVVPPTGGAAAGGLLRTGDYEIATAPTTWVDKSGLIKNYFLGKNIEFTPDRLFSMLFQNLGIRNVAEFKNANITPFITKNPEALKTAQTKWWFGKNGHSDDYVLGFKDNATGTYNVFGVASCKKDAFAGLLTSPDQVLELKIDPGQDTVFSTLWRKLNPLLSHFKICFTRNTKD